ncbi:MAG: RimK family alpha-L-glutamate ligase [Gammaproteobacteria bacterium]|nr:RimK family alpha-L-glutamate ligase [Gammaproteobacteria bacterium]
MGKNIPQIAIVTDEPGWHGEQLTIALDHHGLGSRYLSLTECQLTFDESDALIRMPGFEQQLPLGVFVRGIPGGTLEQVIFRLDVLHALVELGVVVYNNPRAIERTVDKAMTSFLLKQAGLPTPRTWVFESLEQAQEICRMEFARGHRLVIKPLFGSQGIGIHLINVDTGLIHDEKFTGLYYLQSFVERGGTDWFDIRVFVIDGKARAAMLRRGVSWITNRAQGARCEPLSLDANLAELAESAVRAINADYAGVDLIPDATGQLQIIEVNGVPAWWGLQGVTEFNIASSLVDHFVRRIGETHALTVQS